MTDLKPILYVSATHHAVDIAVITKRDALLNVTADYRIPLEKVGAIGDGANDLPFLTVGGLGRVGAPANADLRVKAALLKIPGSIICQESVFRGFLEFYNAAVVSGIQLIFCDRDGVLVDTAEDDFEPLREFLHAPSTRSGPRICVLTGSSARQNIKFIERLESFVGGHAVQPPNDTFSILAENGSVVIDVKSRVAKPNIADWMKSRLQLLKESVEPEFLADVREKVLPKYELGIVFNEAGSGHDVIVQTKQTMVTLDLPRNLRNRNDEKATLAAERLRIEMVTVAVEVGKRHGFSVERL